MKNTVQNDQNKDVINGLKSAILSSGTKKNDIVLNKWATNKDNLSVDAVENLESTYTGLNAVEFLEQNDSVIKNAAGKIPRDFAAGILNNQSLTKDISNSKRNTIETAFGISKNTQETNNNQSKYSYDKDGNEKTDSGIYTGGQK